MDYREARDGTLASIDRVLEIRDAAPLEELAEYVDEVRYELTAAVEELCGNPDARQVIDAEPAIHNRFMEMMVFWHRLQSLSLLGEPSIRRQASTTLPPVPPEEITGQSVRDFIRDLRIWLRDEAEALWRCDVLELPDVPERYLIGDFAQTLQIIRILAGCAELRGQWINLADCGAYWDTVAIGACRAKLLWLGVRCLQELMGRTFLEMES